MSDRAIPVVDLSKFVNGNEAEKMQFRIGAVPVQLLGQTRMI